MRHFLLPKTVDNNQIDQIQSKLNQSPKFDPFFYAFQAYMYGIYIAG